MTPSLRLLPALALLIWGVAAVRQPAKAALLADGDWPQLGRDAQRTNASPQQVDPPYCYTWKWYEPPIAGRAQVVVSGGRLFVGSMEGIFYARDAATGAPLWSFAAGSPIRHAAGLLDGAVVFSTQDGYTYALGTSSGALRWKTFTGSSSTAPLMDSTRLWAYVASSNGQLTALKLADGSVIWQMDAGAPILTSPSLAVDGQTIFLGSEAIEALAVRAVDGGVRWRSPLQGQSLAERYPVVMNDRVFYRSQPLDFFHVLLQEGDATLAAAGAVNPDWTADWNAVRPQIMNYLTTTPWKQTFFTLNPSTGASLGTAPVLYTYGNNDIPMLPVVSGSSVFLAYRPRHGIQTDGGSVHVSSQYDAELGVMDAALNITGLRQSNYPAYSAEFRMTSDEPADLTLGGDILWVDSWERLGGINTKTGQLVHVGDVSNTWPECILQTVNGAQAANCGPGSSNPFFPLSGNPADPAYPFPSPRVTDGNVRGGVVIANGMLYWRVIEGGLAGISHRTGSACPAPLVYTDTDPPASRQPEPQAAARVETPSARPLEEYVDLDLTAPTTNPPADLVDRLRKEVQALVESGGHLMPFYLERGFSTHFLWPYNVPPDKTGLPAVAYGSNGNVYWHDPAELLLSLAQAFPYLDSALQAKVKNYMAAEMQRYPPLQDLPWGDSQNDWLRQGVARERYAVPFRAQLNNWPPPAASLSAIYAVWLWAKNTGDWVYAQAHFNEATVLFNALKDSPAYYADIAGAIGYARLAQHFGNASAYDLGRQAAIHAMTLGLDFQAYTSRADHAYLDGRDQPTGWYVPVFFGLTPEVGLYLREQVNGQAVALLLNREAGDGLRWWYLTRAGAHAEVGETSYAAPSAAWSHFLAHAYLAGDRQEILRPWLDRPWGLGDLYSIQKLAATLQAVKALPDYSQSLLDASPKAPHAGQVVHFMIKVSNLGAATGETVQVSDTLPPGLAYVAGSLSAPSGAVDDAQAPTLGWSGVIDAGASITITFQAAVATGEVLTIEDKADITSPSTGAIQRSVTIVANGYMLSLPIIRK